MVRICGHNFEGWFKKISELSSRTGVYVVGWDGYAVRYTTSSMLRVPFPDLIKYVDILDVGESDNIRECVENHERRSCWERWAKLPDGGKGTMMYAQLLTPDFQQRKQIVQEIREKERPPCGM
jgi:hypothetical protein